jgi:hypothetical protein
MVLEQPKKKQSQNIKKIKSLATALRRNVFKISAQFFATLRLCEK